MLQIRRSDRLAHENTLQSAGHDGPGYAPPGRAITRWSGSSTARDTRHPPSVCRGHQQGVDCVTMHVIVVGCGRVGSGLVTTLEGAGHTVAIIDRQARAFRRLEAASAQRLIGTGFDRDTLKLAGAERAAAFAAVTSGDNSNILAARIAKETFQIPSVVARIYDPRRASIYQKLGIATVATVAWTTDQVTRRLLGDTASVWTDQSGTLSLTVRTLPEVWAGHKLAGLTEGDRFRVVAFSRAGQARIYSPDVVGQEGDVLHCLVRTDAAEEFEARLAAGSGEGH